MCFAIIFQILEMCVINMCKIYYLFQKCLLWEHDIKKTCIRAKRKKRINQFHEKLLSKVQWPTAIVKYIANGEGQPLHEKEQTRAGGGGYAAHFQAFLLSLGFVFKLD